MKHVKAQLARHWQSGLTLIELMITVAILGIIASIAIPAYTQYTQAARRSDARAALTQIASIQAEYVLNHSNYAGNVTSVGLTSISENGYYTLVVSATGATSFTGKATARGVQLKDTDCRTFQITQTGSKTAKNSSGSDTTNTCW